MARPIRCPLIRTLLDDHTRVAVTYREGDEPVIGCGETWCRGDCGLPAITMPEGNGWPALKMRSSMVAYGELMQPFRCAWTGATVEVPEEHRADFLRRVWQ